jgi:hypothetical protein
LARFQQDVSGYLDLHDEEQILERITSQDWSGLAFMPTVDMGRGVMATRFFRSGSVVCDYHGPVLKRDQAESLRKSMSAAESNYMYFFKYDSQRLCIDAATVPCVCHPRIPTTFGRMVNHSGVHPNLRRVGFAGGLVTASICYSSPRLTSNRTKNFSSITVSEVTTRVVDYLSL